MQMMDMLDIETQPTDLLSALAALAEALPKAVGVPPDLLDCYSLFADLCEGADLRMRSVDGDSAGNVGDGLIDVLGVMTVLNPSEITGLQEHLSSLIIQQGSELMSSNEDVMLEVLEKRLCLLRRFEVPLLPACVTACIEVCNQHAPDTASISR